MAKALPTRKVQISSNKHARKTAKSCFLISLLFQPGRNIIYYQQKVFFKNDQRTKPNPRTEGMMKQEMISEVKLLDGSIVKINLDNVKAQYFLRIGPHLILSAFNNKPEHGVFVWQKVDDVYQQIGDIYFDWVHDIVHWNINILQTPEIESGAESIRNDFLRKFAHSCRKHTDLLSAPPKEKSNWEE